MVTFAPSSSSAFAQRPDSRLIIVSNRGPIEHFVTESGTIRRRSAGGGVAVALSSVADKTEVTWVAAAGSFADGIVARTGQRVPIGRSSELRLLALTNEAYQP